MNPEELEVMITSAVEKTLQRSFAGAFSKLSHKQVYTIDETCELLDVTRRHLQYLRDTRQIGYVQNGRKILFRAEDLESFFNDHYIKGGHES